MRPTRPHRRSNDGRRRFSYLRARRCRPGGRSVQGGVAAGPWLIVSNHEGRHFHGEQYIALTLTTKSWLDCLVEILEALWLEGGTPAESRIFPWGVQLIRPVDIEYWQGRRDDNVVDEAVTILVKELLGE